MTRGDEQKAFGFARARGLSVSQRTFDNPAWHARLSKSLDKLREISPESSLSDLVQLDEDCRTITLMPAFYDSEFANHPSRAVALGEYLAAINAKTGYRAPPEPAPSYERAGL